MSVWGDLRNKSQQDIFLLFSGADTYIWNILQYSFSKINRNQTSILNKAEHRFAIQANDTVSVTTITEVNGKTDVKSSKGGIHTL